MTYGNTKSRSRTFFNEGELYARFYDKDELIKYLNMLVHLCPDFEKDSLERFRDKVDQIDSAIYTDIHERWKLTIARSKDSIVCERDQIEDKKESKGYATKNDSRSMS